jgi:hypothetical protein
MRGLRFFGIISVIALLSSYCGLQYYAYTQEEKIKELVKEAQSAKRIHYADSANVFKLCDSIRNISRAIALQPTFSDAHAISNKTASQRTANGPSAELLLQSSSTDTLIKAPATGIDFDNHAAVTNIKNSVDSTLTRKIKKLSINWVYDDKNKNFLFKGNVPYDKEFWKNQCDSIEISNFEQLYASGFEFDLHVVHFSNSDWKDFHLKHKWKARYYSLAWISELDSNKDERIFYVRNYKPTDFPLLFYYLCSSCDNAIQVKFEKQPRDRRYYAILSALEYKQRVFFKMAEDLKESERQNKKKGPANKP